MKPLHRILSRIPQRAPAPRGQPARLARPAPRHSGGFVHGLLGLAVATLAGGCATEPHPPVPATITIFPDSATLLWVGDTVRLAANVWPVAWTSDDESVVTVDSAGVVTAVGKGVASVRGAVKEVEGLTTITVNPDRSVLVEIHEALGGSGWRRDDNWGTDAPLDKWYGVTADSEGNVQALRLPANGLSGTIPPAIGHLGALDTLNLFRNDLTGPVPPELGNLRQLRLLSLGWNDLTGPVPPELGNLTSLAWLDLARNRLSGSIPPELGDLSNLSRLSLWKNELTGAIPSELGNLSSLRDLWLSENELTGTIPAELGQLSTVIDLGVQNNNLSGPIPPELGHLSSLAQLALYNNDLSGPLPPEIGNLSKLVDLRLHDNPDLEGLLPRSVLNLHNLSYLDISGTDLCAQLDAEFREWLASIPEAYGWRCPATQVERHALAEFYASTDGDSWTNNDGWNSDADVDDWYGVTVGDSLVEQLRLPDNGLDGPLPPVIGNLQALESFDVADNTLNGVFPVALVIDALDTIRISGNEDMIGPLPFDMIEMEELKALEFEDTDLCASPSKTFQEWIDSLDVAEGATCDNPDSVKLSLPVVYLNQAIQRPEGDVPLLPDRDALLRVFLVGDQENAFFEPEVFATFMRDGEEVHRVVMQSEQDRVPTVVDEGDLIKSYNAVIPAKYFEDGTEFVVVADSAEVIPRAEGSQTRFPETGSAALNVIEVPPLELTVVPVLYADDPDSSIFEWTDSIDDDSENVGLFKHSFPFSEFGASSWDTAYVTSLDPTEDAWEILLDLETVYKSAKATGYWYAVADSKEGYVRGIARLNGWVSYGKPWDTELAHEVGHTLNLRHAPCGGPSGVDPDFPYDNGSIGMWGWDSRDSSLVSPYTRRDIMGYCYEQGWLSDYYYEKVIDLREDKEGDPQEGRAGAGPEGRMLVLWGGVLDGELRIEPVHSMYTTPTLPRETGPYTLEGVTSGGVVEFSLSFTPGEDIDGNKYFLFWIPIEEDWEDTLDRITLTGPEGEVTVDDGDPRSLTVVTDPATGLIRAILRDWNRVLPGALGDTSGLEVVTTRGLQDAVRLR
ncbi:MAG: Ig-like domain-containing protein [Gemmatimonadota bacterium]|nr:Ig-like domain-containing protein [Gemmatimonadota bacterium]MDE2871590.1 Ig-like domain-containing protein [Gemmatimonadota bacterium]